jgi:hypothetical protein
MLPVAGFDASRIELPDFGLTGGYGSELVALGDAPRVALSLPSGGAKCPWVCADVESGAVMAARGLRGDVRDGELDREGRGWLLTTSALVRVDVTGALRILDVLAPKGLGRDHSRLLPMGDDRYGVCSWLGQTLSVVDVRTSTTVKKIRVAAPHVSVLSEETVKLYAPHGGRRLVLRRNGLERLEDTAMPTGTRPFFEGGEVVMVLGTRRPIAHSSAWEIAREALGIFDASTFDERVRAPVPTGAREVLGMDHEGRVVISTDDGLALVDRATLRETARLTLPIANGIRAHLFLGEHQAMVMIDQDRQQELVVARW